MRKILLGTTAVVGAALLSTGAFAQGTTAGTGSAAPASALAGAGDLTVRLGGYYAFTGAIIQDDNDRAYRVNPKVPYTAARSRYDFRNDLELHVFIDGRAANGMTYGAVFEFQMDNMQGAAADNAGVSMDEAYGFVAFPNLGRLYFGQEDAAASLLIVRAPTVTGLGGDAEWDEFIVNSGLYSSPYLTSGIADGNDATKIGYLSPQFAGFDFGISYAPNAGEGERVELSNGTPQRERTTREHEISAAVRYRGTFGPVGVQVGVGGLWAKAQRNFFNTPVQRPQDINAYFVGAQVAAYGFAFGGEFGFGSYNGSSMGTTALNPGLDDSWHYLIGATYTMGPVMFGAIFGQAEQDNGWGLVNKVLQELPDRRHTVWGLGAVYRLAPGLEVFAAYNNIHDKNIPMAAPSDARYSGFSGTALASFNGQYTRTINIGIAGIRLAF